MEITTDVRIVPTGWGVSGRDYASFVRQSEPSDVSIPSADVNLLAEEAWVVYRKNTHRWYKLYLRGASKLEGIRCMILWTIVDGLDWMSDRLEGLI